MNKKVCYTRVTDIAAKAPSKKLAQGSLTGHSSSLLLSDLSECQQFVETGKKAHVPIHPIRQPKVVCHSPAKVSKRFSNCKLTEKIVVDSPPTVFVTGSASNIDSINSDSGIHTTRALAQNSALDNISTARPVHVEGENEHLGGKMIDDVSSLHGSGVTKPKKAIFSMQEKAETALVKETSKKKKQTKIVPSRYKQQASFKGAAMLNKSTSTKTKLNNYSTNHCVMPTFHKTGNTTEKKIVVGKTSTPTGRYNKTMFESDMSSIQVVPFDKKREVLPCDKKREPETVAKSENLSETDLRIAHAKYLRAAYMNAALQKSAQTRQKSALNHVTNLCDANLRLQQEVTDLENEVKSLKYETLLEHQVDQQVKNLGPALNRISSACHKYKHMVENIDTTRHGLPVVDVKVSALNKLETSLQNMAAAINDVNVLSHSHRESCAEAAKSVKSLNQTVLSEVDTCNETNHEITLLKKLSIKETNLKLQLSNENAFT